MPADAKLAGLQRDFAAFLLRLRGKGSVPKALIAAFEATPRRMFLAGQFHPVAWSDRMLPIECGEAMEGADLQAAVIAALSLEPGSRVLDLGCGDGRLLDYLQRTRQVRGAGVELRIYGCPPDQAEARARELDFTVLAGAVDKPHGLRECVILDHEGYAWVPGIGIPDPTG